MSGCSHPGGLLMLVDAGLSIRCGKCSQKWNVSRWILDLMIDPDIEGRHIPAATAGPTLDAIAMHCARLDFALRSMGRAFWRQDHTPAQENALQLSQDALKDFSEMRPHLQELLEAVITNFPKANLERNSE